MQSPAYKTNLNIQRGAFKLIVMADKMMKLTILAKHKDEALQIAKKDYKVKELISTVEVAKVYELVIVTPK